MIYFIYDNISYIGSYIKDTTTHYYNRTSDSLNRFCYNYIYTKSDTIILNI